MFSPRTITVKHPDGSTDKIDVSDSHELYDKLEELKAKYPDSVITYPIDSFLKEQSQ